ncbi:Kinesin-like protein subito [Blattella germanica]|nr:Kinesin-like protein subito [Blattella germanica]
MRKFSFCDLAGAERVKNTQNVGERLRESQNINTSLHVLGRCLTTIRQPKKENLESPDSLLSSSH